MFRLTLLAAAAALAAALAVPQAHAQFGPFFGDGPPRPPGNIRNPSPPPMDDEEEVPELPQGRLLPAPNRPLPQGQGAPPPGSYQSQPLPPPPGTSVVPQNPQAPPPAANAPAAAPPPATANVPAAQPPANTKGAPRGPAPPSPATLQPGDEIVTEPPKQKIVNKKAVFSGLDKITGRITTFDADIGETVQFGALRVKPDACYTRPATEATNTDAFVEVDEITLQGEVKRIFSGWMFAASPGLHGVEHPIYDIWLADCKAPDAAVAAQQPAPVAAPAPASQKQRAAPKQQPAPRPQAPPPPQQAPLLPPFSGR